jgi:hypothetical protein
MRLAALLLVTLFAAPAVAAEPLRFKFQPGQTLTYTARQVTTVVETTLEEGTNRHVNAATVTKLALTRRWNVKAVETGGVATLELIVVAMRQQITRPGPADINGKPTIDTEVLDSATPEGRHQMAAFIDKPIATVKLDSQGRVLEATGPPAERLRVELPFRLVLPDAGDRWNRAFSLAIGTGEKYDFTQTFAVKGDTGGVWTIQVQTAPKATPTDPGEWVPLAPVLWEGEVSFDRANGRYLGAKLTAKKEVANHQGDGTRFSYESVLVEEIAR